MKLDLSRNNKNISFTQRKKGRKISWSHTLLARVCVSSAGRKFTVSVLKVQIRRSDTWAAPIYPQLGQRWLLPPPPPWPIRLELLRKPARTVHCLCSDTQRPLQEGLMAEIHWADALKLHPSVCMCVQSDTFTSHDVTLITCCSSNTLQCSPLATRSQRSFN